VCKIFNENEAAIREYCEKNGLNFDVVENSPKCFNNEYVFIQYVDYEKGMKQLLGLLDETPAPIILKIFKTPNGLFEQTEHTAQYLAV